MKRNSLTEKLTSLDARASASLRAVAKELYEEHDSYRQALQGNFKILVRRVKNRRASDEELDLICALVQSSKDKRRLQTIMRQVTRGGIEASIRAILLENPKAKMEATLAEVKAQYGLGAGRSTAIPIWKSVKGI